MRTHLHPGVLASYTTNGFPRNISRSLAPLQGMQLLHSIFLTFRSKSDKINVIVRAGHRSIAIIIIIVLLLQVLNFLRPRLNLRHLRIRRNRRFLATIRYQLPILTHRIRILPLHLRCPFPILENITLLPHILRNITQRRITRIYKTESSRSTAQIRWLLPRNSHLTLKRFQRSWLLPCC